jgi:hypothetical protein
MVFGYLRVEFFIHLILEGSMVKTLLTFNTSVICLVLYIPVCFALETGTSSQGTETKMLHAEHVFMPMLLLVARLISEKASTVNGGLSPFKRCRGNKGIKGHK